MHPRVLQRFSYSIWLASALEDICHQKPAQGLHFRRLRRGQPFRGERLHFVHRAALVQQTPGKEEIAFRSIRAASVVSLIDLRRCRRIVSPFYWTMIRPLSDAFDWLV